MYEKEKPTGIERFMALEEGKRERIINACMKEFQYGFKKASTDIMVKEAGISKGLLYHYFNTKEDLYSFLTHYAMDTLQKDYFDMITLGQSDILESIWQMVLLKKDIIDRYTHIYRFIASFEGQERAEKQKAIMQDVYASYDKSLFREDVNSDRAIDIIIGFLDSLDESGDYESFLAKVQEYLDIFRKCFYKQGGDN